MVDVLHQLREMVGFRAVCVCVCVYHVAEQPVVLTQQVHTSEWKDL